MNVCMLTSFFLPTIGGVENHVYHLAKELQKFGHDVTVIHTCFDIENDSSGDVKVEFVDGIEVHRLYIGVMKFKLKLPYMSLFNSYANGFLRKIRPICNSNYVVKYIVNLHQKKNFDVLHQHDFISNVFATKLLKKYVPVIITNHTGEYLLLDRYKVTSMILPMLLRHFDYLIGPSGELADVEYMKRRNKAVYIANGCDTDEFYPINKSDIQMKRLALGLPKDRKIVLCARRWAPTKGVIYLVQAIKYVLEKHPQTFFLISGNDYYGYPEYRDDVYKVIEQDNVGGNIILLGDIPYNKMRDYDQIADIVTLPSLLEATSLSGLEAMSCGKPLVGSNVGGIPEIIDDGETGILVHKENPKDIAEAINKLLSDEKMAEDFGKQARRKAVEEFSWEVIARRTEEIYKKVIR